MPRDIPAYSLRSENRQVLLAKRPEGVPQASDFALATSAVPKPGAGEFLLRNIYLSVDPAQRGWASAEANYSAPVPLGGPMRALTIGVVVESQHADYKPGDFLYGWFGWQDYVVATEKQVIHRATQDIPLAGFLALIGIAGTTAYLALTELGRPKPGDTLLVSTAAGSVGSLVGQIGKSLGCRTIGLTGSDDKVERCRARFGYDVAINYKSADLDAEIAKVAPNGVNVFFDNTGGSILDTALRRLAVGARVVQCGTASIGSWNPPPTGPRNEREILTRRLVWSGFIIFDYMAQYATAADELARLFNAGKVTYELDVSDDIATAPGAIAALYAGENNGKKIIYIG
ncbi:MAG: NADP-dependent oxidoreductase [Rhizobiales bacterium PAR1]|nr:MAG: NADP-dependent oxidoreductase [Rhizobiales bacterium PAR1]